MNRAAASAVIATSLALAGCGSTSTTVIERSTQTVTARPVPAPTVTKTVPGPTVTKTEQASSSTTGGITCWSFEGAAYLSSPGVGTVAESDCTVTFTPVIPYSSGEVTITVTAPPPAAATSTWTIPNA